MSTHSRSNWFAWINSFLLVSLAPTLVFAGATKAGDGGHGISCPSGFGRTIRLLESAEARALYGMRLTTPTGLGMGVPPHLLPNYEGLVVPKYMRMLRSRAMNVLGSDHPFLRMFENAANIYFEQGELTSEIGQTDDWGNIRVSISSRCSLIQLARRQGREIHIFKSSYWRLPLQDKAGLIVHESLHEWFEPQSNTQLVRDAVIYLMGSPSFRTRNKMAFERLVNSKTPQRFTN